MPSTPRLPQGADSLLKLAAQSTFDLCARTAQGLMEVDREHRIVWISDGLRELSAGAGHRGRGTEITVHPLATKQAQVDQFGPR